MADALMGTCQGMGHMESCVISHACYHANEKLLSGVSTVGEYSVVCTFVGLRCLAVSTSDMVFVLN